MYKVFNMGHRLELYVPAEAAQHIIAVANKYHIDAQVIGRVEKSSGKRLTIQSKHGVFEY
jgi:phosphoribosylformylglycinamidine cyclo-ligase